MLLAVMLPYIQQMVQKVHCIGKVDLDVFLGLVLSQQYCPPLRNLTSLHKAPTSTMFRTFAKNWKQVFLLSISVGLP